ncbi:hypothetical protein [Desulfosporosinus sp. OT]|uniref:hypothetical protein n=1 Tax=Desulfosporosinus sp. OT TaxID=913865 RepID=UPI000223A1B6|nr:hypothetical protein [Desulfosporosinus sp. OT]EGW37922.1 hypothetical protein DOT_4188 [Desulfosporosinus sp. OT]
MYKILLPSRIEIKKKIPNIKALIVDCLITIFGGSLNHLQNKETWQPPTTKTLSSHVLTFLLALVQAAA